MELFRVFWLQKPENHSTLKTLANKSQLIGCLTGSATSGWQLSITDGLSCWYHKAFTRDKLELTVGTIEKFSDMLHRGEYEVLMKESQSQRLFLASVKPCSESETEGVEESLVQVKLELDLLPELITRSKLQWFLYQVVEKNLEQNHGQETPARLPGPEAPDASDSPEVEFLRNQLQQKERQLALSHVASLNQFGTVTALRKKNVRKTHVPSVQNKKGMSLLDPRERAQKKPKGAVFANSSDDEPTNG